MQARKHIRLFLLSLTLGLANAASAHPYAEYRVTVVGPAHSGAADINNAGVVVGSYPFSATSSHGFLNRGKGLVDLGTLGGTGSGAAAINDKGVVLGNWTTKAGQNRGFIYYGGKQRDIGVRNGASTRYTDINNAGYITADQNNHGFLRSPHGKFTDLGFLPSNYPGEPNTYTFALNNKNQVTGTSGTHTAPEDTYHAFIWSKGVIRDLGDLGFDNNWGLAINDRGQITGYASLQGLHAQRAFLYSNGRVVAIDTRPDASFTGSAGTGINNHGHIVGVSDDLSGFIWRGHRRQSLNSLIDPKLGWDIQSPEAINDAGQIAATAVRKGVSYAVRLDLIRPMAVSAPELEPDEEAAVAAQPVSPEEAAAQAKADAEAQAREVARPVQQ